MATVERGSKQLRLLSLDGGGVRGLSSLLILKKLMESVAEDPEDPPKPCDHFDMIGGTSTGGLIAIMLGRLGMTVNECIAEYKTLSPSIFTKIHRMKVGVRFQGKLDLVIKDRFDHNALETGIRALLKKRGIDPESLFKEAPNNSKCHTFVCATSGETSQTVILSNYYSRRRGNDILSVAKIWEVARATCAASSFFESVTIGGETFKDGGTGANNPIHQLWNEATDIFGSYKPEWQLEDHLKAIVSIGTGLPLLTAFGDSVKELGKALVAVSTNTVQVHNLFQQQHSALFRQPGSRAFRFNVVQGLEQVGLEDESKVPLIEAATRGYIVVDEVFRALEACAGILQTQTACT